MRISSTFHLPDKSPEYSDVEHLQVDDTFVDDTFGMDDTFVAT